MKALIFNKRGDTSIVNFDEYQKNIGKYKDSDVYLLYRVGNQIMFLPPTLVNEAKKRKPDLDVQLIKSQEDLYKLPEKIPDLPPENMEEAVFRKATFLENYNPTKLSFDVLKNTQEYVKQDVLRYQQPQDVSKPSEIKEPKEVKKPKSMSPEEAEFISKMYGTFGLPPTLSTGIDDYLRYYYTLRFTSKVAHGLWNIAQLGLDLVGMGAKKIAGLDKVAQKLKDVGVSGHEFISKTLKEEDIEEVKQFLRTQSARKGVGYLILNDMAETGVDLAAYFTTIKLLAGFKAPHAVTGGRIIPSILAERGTSFAKFFALAGTGKPLDEGGFKERINQALHTLAYTSTPYISNLITTHPIGVRFVDIALNNFLSLGLFYYPLYKEKGQIDDEFIINAIPQFVTDVGFALSTRPMLNIKAVKFIKGLRNEARKIFIDFDKIIYDELQKNPNLKQVTVEAKDVIDAYNNKRLDEFVKSYTEKGKIPVIKVSENIDIEKRLEEIKPEEVIPQKGKIENIKLEEQDIISMSKELNVNDVQSFKKKTYDIIKDINKVAVHLSPESRKILQNNLKSVVKEIHQYDGSKVKFYGSILPIIIDLQKINKTWTIRNKLTTVGELLKNIEKSESEIRNRLKKTKEGTAQWKKYNEMLAAIDEAKKIKDKYERGVLEVIDFTLVNKYLENRKNATIQGLRNAIKKFEKSVKLEDNYKSTLRKNILGTDDLDKIHSKEDLAGYYIFLRNKFNKPLKPSEIVNIDKYEKPKFNIYQLYSEITGNKIIGKSSDIKEVIEPEFKDKGIEELFKRKHPSIKLPKNIDKLRVGLLDVELYFSHLAKKYGNDAIYFIGKDFMEGADFYRSIYTDILNKFPDWFFKMDKVSHERISRFLAGEKIKLTDMEKKALEVAREVYLDTEPAKLIYKTVRFIEYKSNKRKYKKFVKNVAEEDLKELEKLYKEGDLTGFLDKIKNTKGFLITEIDYYPMIKETPEKVDLLLDHSMKLMGISHKILKPRQAKEHSQLLPFGDMILRKIQSDLRLFTLAQPLRNMNKLIRNVKLDKQDIDFITSYLKNFTYEEADPYERLAKAGIGAIIKASLIQPLKLARQKLQPFTLLPYVPLRKVPATTAKILAMTFRRGGAFNLEANKTFQNAPEEVRNYFTTKVMEESSILYELFAMRMRSSALDKLGGFGKALRWYFSLYGKCDTTNRWTVFKITYDNVMNALNKYSKHKNIKKILGDIHFDSLPDALQREMLIEIDNGNYQYVALEIARYVASPLLNFNYGVHRGAIGAQRPFAKMMFTITTFGRGTVMRWARDMRRTLEGMIVGDFRQATRNASYLIKDWLICFLIEQTLVALWGKRKYSYGYKPWAMMPEFGEIVSSITGYWNIASEFMHDIDTQGMDKALRNFARTIDRASYEMIPFYRNVLWTLEVAYGKEKIRPFINLYWETVGKRYAKKKIKEEMFTKNLRDYIEMKAVNEFFSKTLQENYLEYLKSKEKLEKMREQITGLRDIELTALEIARKLTGAGKPSEGFLEKQKEKERVKKLWQQVLKEKF